MEQSKELGKSQRTFYRGEIPSHKRTKSANLQHENFERFTIPKSFRSSWKLLTIMEKFVDEWFKFSIDFLCFTIYKHQQVSRTNLAMTTKQ
jgi:hypothetical protein